MDGNVVLFRSTGEGEWVVLPYGNLWTAQENVLETELVTENPVMHLLLRTHLTSTSLCVLFLDLNLDDIARMLDDFRNKSFMSSSHLSSNPLGQIKECSVHPVLPENSDSSTERSEVRLDHAESSVNRPKYEEYNEEVVSVPKSFEVRPSWLFHRRKYHGHQSKEHHISSPSWSRYEVCKKPSWETELVRCSQSCKVDPMSNRMDPAKKYDRPGGKFVERDIFVERNDTV